MNRDVILDVRGLRKSYPASGGEGTLEILAGLDLRLGRGEFLTIFGPNGCGKSTLLRILIKDLKHDGGIVDTPAGPLTFGFVFQNYAASLFPWRKVWENVALRWELDGAPRKECRRKAIDLLEELRFDVPVENYPYQISSGQQQMTAIARAVAKKVDVLLMDEPFSSLDYETRIMMHQRIQEVQRVTSASVILVSHDLDEALLLADSVLVLSPRPGRVLARVPVAFARPRSPQLLADASFVVARQYAYLAFLEGLHATVT